MLAKLGMSSFGRARVKRAVSKPRLEPLEDRCLLSSDVVVELPIPPGFGHPVDIAPGPDGNLWFTEANSGVDFATSNYVGRMTPAGQVTEFPIPPESISNIMGGALHITAGPDGNLWITEFNLGKIARVTVTGQVTEFTVPSSTASLDGITAGPDGNVWFTEIVVDNTGRDVGQIGRITPAGQVSEFRIPIVGDSEPRSITTGPDGNLWFTDSGAGDIGRITPQGTITLFPIRIANASPEGIATGADGNLWFGDLGTKSIGRLTPQGDFTEFPLPSGTVVGPQFLTTGADGNVWFTESLNDKVGQITPGGAITEFATPSPQSAPSGITAGPDGNIWFAEVGALSGSPNKIGKVIMAGPTANERYIERLYADLLHRAADPAGLSAWIGVLNRGVARTQVAFAFEQSTEYRTDEVEALYNQLLGRAADPGGLAVSLNFLAAGGSIKRLEAVLLGSDEYFARHGIKPGGPMNPPPGGNPYALFLRAVYQDVLHRPIDSAGLQAWSQALASGASPTALAAAILVSPESDGDEVDALYQQFLHRPADNSGRALFVAALENGVPIEVVQALMLGSDEYFVKA
jgi:streptogramin lyase